MPSKKKSKLSDEMPYIECEYCWNQATRTRTDSFGRWYYCGNCAPSDAVKLTVSNYKDETEEQD